MQVDQDMGSGLTLLDKGRLLSRICKKANSSVYWKEKALYLGGIALDSQIYWVGQAGLKRCGFQLGNHVALLLFAGRLGCC